MTEVAAAGSPAEVFQRPGVAGREGEIALEQSYRILQLAGLFRLFRLGAQRLRVAPHLVAVNQVDDREQDQQAGQDAQH